jgi:hypothetical protein
MCMSIECAFKRYGPTNWSFVDGLSAKTSGRLIGAWTFRINAGS